MHRMLTVKEVLIYQANLRLPSTISKAEKKLKVNEVKHKVFGNNVYLNIFYLQQRVVASLLRIMAISNLENLYLT